MCAYAVSKQHGSSSCVGVGNMPLFRRFASRLKSVRAGQTVADRSNWTRRNTCSKSLALFRPHRFGTRSPSEANGSSRPLPWPRGNFCDARPVTTGKDSPRGRRQGRRDGSQRGASARRDSDWFGVPTGRRLRLHPPEISTDRGLGCGSYQLKARGGPARAAFASAPRRSRISIFPASRPSRASRTSSAGSLTASSGSLMPAFAA